MGREGSPSLPDVTRREEQQIMFAVERIAAGRKGKRIDDGQEDGQRRRRGRVPRRRDLFFAELGLELEGRFTVEGEWAGRVTGVRDQRVEIAMMRTPDGHGRLELSRFLTPPVVADHRNAPVNALGYLRIMFAVEDLDDTLGRLRKLGRQLVGEVVRYEDAYRLCYIRGPEGPLLGLAEELG
jgi:catechol 2,3-dioxygenase-like lactoylglutathione lyase family enzyme